MFWHRRLHIQMFLFGDAFTRSYHDAQMLLHRDAFTQRNFCTQTRGCFYTQTPLHSNAFTHRSFYTHVFLHRKSFDTEYPLHREKIAQILLRGFFLNANTFIQRRFWNTDNTQILSQKSVLHGYLYTEMLLHTGAFRTRTRLGRGTFAWVRLDTRFTGGFKPFWTQAAIQSRLYVYMQIRFLQGDAFVHKCSYTAMGLRTEMV